MPLFDLSVRIKLRLAGSDRVRFLNGQLTNDVRKANANLLKRACLLSVNENMDAYILIGAGADNLFVDAAAESKETLAARLDRYLIADDVTIEDVTKQFALFHVTGESAPTLPNDMRWRRGKRFGTAGWDLVVAAAERESVRRLLATHYPTCDAASAERIRIEQGIPGWGLELTNQIIPGEAGLEESAIDYAKGCYVGQEVISRMKMSGQTNKRLRGLVSVDGFPLSPGMRLYAAKSDKEVGWITSATRSDRLGKEIALGFVKRGSTEIGGRLSARRADDAAEVEVAEMPFR